MVTATETRKAWTSPLVLKQDEDGAIEAVFTTFGVVDKDGDIIERGAFDDGIRLPLLHSHRHMDLAIGGGTIQSRGDEGVFAGRFYTEADQGRDAYTTTKALIADGIVQEVSWGFVVREARMPSDVERQGGALRVITRTEPIEVSLVLRGAGQNTRVLAVKNDAPTLEEQYASLRDDISDFADRLKARAVLRATEGRPLSKASLALLRDFEVDLKAVQAGLVDLLAPESQKHPERDRLYAQFLRIESGV